MIIQGVKFDDNTFENIINISNIFSTWGEIKDSNPYNTGD